MALKAINDTSVGPVFFNTYNTRKEGIVDLTTMYQTESTKLHFTRRAHKSINIKRSGVTKEELAVIYCYSLDRPQHIRSVTRFPTETLEQIASKFGTFIVNRVNNVYITSKKGEDLLDYQGRINGYGHKSPMLHKPIRPNPPVPKNLKKEPLVQVDKHEITKTVDGTSASSLPELIPATKPKRWCIPQTLDAFLRLVTTKDFSVLLGKKATRLNCELLEQLKTNSILNNEFVARLKRYKLKTNLKSLKKNNNVEDFKDIPKRSKELKRANKNITSLKKVYKSLLLSLTIVLKTLKYKTVKRFKNKYNKIKLNVPDGLIGIVHLFSDLFKRILSRGMTTGICWLSEFAQECERCCLDVGSDFPLLRKYFRGENSRIRTNKTALATLATLRRAFPEVIGDLKAQDRAIQRTVEGLCGKVEDTPEDIIESVKEHVRKFCLHTSPTPLDQETEFTSLGSCVESNRAKGGQYKYLHEQSKYTESKARVVTRQDAISGMFYGHFAAVRNHPTLAKFETTLKGTDVVHPRPPARWDATVKRLFMGIMNEQPNVKLTCIPESGARFRVASVHEASQTTLLGPINMQVTNMLRNYGPTKAAFNSDTKSIQNRVFRVRGDDIKYYSSDFSQASDLMHKDVLKAIVETLAEELKWPLLYKRAALRSIAPSMLHYELSTGKKVDVTTRGSLLGSPLSFALMCLLHAWCIKALPKYQRKGAVLYGDDSAIPTTNRGWELFKARCSAVGFKINEKKTHISRIGFQFCGYIYHLTRGKLTSIKLSKLTKDKEDWNTRLDLHISSCKDLAPWQLKRANNLFTQKEHNVLYEFIKCGVPLYGPRELGGVGLYRQRKSYTETTSLIASVLMTRNNSQKELEILNLLSKPWVIAHLPPSASEIAENIAIQTKQVTFDPEGYCTYAEAYQKLLGCALHAWVLSEYRDVRSITRRVSPRTVAEKLFTAIEFIERKYGHKFPTAYIAKTDKVVKYLRERKDFRISDESLKALEIGSQSLYITTSGIVRRSPLTNKVINLGRKPQASSAPK